MSERTRGLDRARVQAQAEIADSIHWLPEWSIQKFRDHRDRVYKAGRAGLPLEYLLDNFELIDALKIPGNVLLNEGINALWTLVAGTGATEFDSGHAYIGVGDSNTAAVATQVGLQATTNELYVGMDSSYPTYGSSQIATWRSTFGGSYANFHWQEITVASGNSDAAVNLNRKVQDMGTKASGTSWVASLQITLS